jgi:hypothetical protein
MRKMILGLLLLISSNAFAYDAMVDCYSNGKRIYHGVGTDMIYSDSLFQFYDKKKDQLVIVQAECVIKFL